MNTSPTANGRLSLIFSFGNSQGAFDIEQRTHILNREFAPEGLNRLAACQAFATARSLATLKVSPVGVAPIPREWAQNCQFESKFPSQQTKTNKINIDVTVCAVVCYDVPPRMSPLDKQVTSEIRG
jgi:hypothetical protein